jgi:hypothetical protein
MYTLDDIHVYIFNWKKVSKNTLVLYEKITNILKNVCIVNCDEFLNLNDDIVNIKLDDSHYYGSQYDHAIKHVKENKLFCVIVGDNVSNHFQEIFNNALNTFNNYKVGVYSPNDKRSIHKNILENINESLYNVENTDCGFWFINPDIVKKMKNINYNISKYGWGIDVITIKESRKQGLLVLRDYSVETDQVDHTCGYDLPQAFHGMNLLQQEYNKL